MKRVVIIGGGFAGALIAKRLQGKFNVTLIDTKDYFEFTPSVPRILVEPENIGRVHALHKNYLGKVDVIIGEAREVAGETVLVTTKKDNKKVKFDYLVISSGSRYTTPIKDKHLVIADRANIFKKHHERFRKSKEILIIGGGPVGVELAAEIVSHPETKSKKVTLIHSHDNLIERSNPEAIKYAHKFFLSKGVELICSEKVIGKDGKDFSTDKGKKIKADLAFLCVGIIPNSDFMAKNFSNLLDEKGHIKVNSSLQLEGYKNIFAVGDVNGFAEEKTAQNAEEQAKVVAENLMRLNVGEPLLEYLHKPRIMVLSLGKNDGILTYKNSMVSGFIPAVLKKLIEWKTMIRYR